MRQENISCGLPLYLALGGLLVLNACSRDSLTNSSSRNIWAESFDAERCCSTEFPRQWTVEVTGVNSLAYADVGETGRGVRLVAGGKNEEVRLLKTLDARPFRGQRIVATIRTQLVAQGASGHAFFGISVSRPGHLPTAWDGVDNEATPLDGWQTTSALQDVADDATTVQFRLTARGEVDARFDNFAFTSSPAPHPVSRELTTEEIDRLTALATLVGYLRFFHPADQSAHANWRALEVAAVQRVLGAKGSVGVQDAFLWLLRTVAPTAVLCSDRMPCGPPADLRAPTPNTHLARWRHYGYRGGVYESFRDGIDDEKSIGIRLFRRVSIAELGKCHRATLKPTVRVPTGSPGVEFDITPQAGYQAVGRVTALLGDSANPLGTDLRPEVTVVTFGVAVHKHGIVELTSLVLECDGKEVSRLSVASGYISEGLGRDLYRIEDTSSSTGECIRIARLPDDQVNISSDVIDVAVGLNTRLRMPLVAWTDGHHTLPVQADVANQGSPYSFGDLAARVAGVIDVWITLQWFYPNFRDTNVDWKAQLPIALQGAARAVSAEEQETAIQRLIAALRDDHASLNRFGIYATLPLFFRKHDSDLIVSRVLPPYQKLVSSGSRVIAIDREPVHAALQRIAQTVSATDTYRDFAIATFIGFGHDGELVELRLRAPGSSTETDVILPRVDGTILPKLREEHAKNGSELSPGVYYIDLHTLDIDTWNGLLPRLEQAKGIVFDQRGYITSATFDVLAYLTSKVIESPTWQTPIVSANGPPTYSESSWIISPRLPRITAKAIFLADGRSASAAETVLQIVRDYKLALIVGEQTAGTNGNVTVHETIGRLTLRFTGMRVLSRSGTLIQGVGIAPDIVVHPTLAGLIAGKDEVLDEAVRIITDP